MKTTNIFDLPCLKKLAALLLFALASLNVQGASLLLDFGPTAVSSTADKLNDPAHAIGGLSSSEVSWNSVSTNDVTSLVYSDATAATGVSIDLGRSDAGVTGTVNFNNNMLSTILGSSGLTAGIFAGSSPMKDGIFANGTYPNQTTNMIGLKISGLPAGTYTVFLAARNCNISTSGTNGQDPELIYYSQGPGATTYNFTSAPTKPQANTNNPFNSSSFVPGDNCANFTITLNSGNAIYIGATGSGYDDRGFLNLVEIMPLTAPQITVQPPSLRLYAGRNAKFPVTATGVTSYTWFKNGVALSNGGTISGATASSLTISNIAAADAANYTVVVTNVLGSVTSSVAQLTIATTNSAYESSVVLANPLAYYRFNETEDSLSGATVYDFAGGFNGVYGTSTLNSMYGIFGPTPSMGFPGFSEPNGAVKFAAYTSGAQVTLSPWNITTNSITITSWINPSFTPEPASAGLVVSSGANVAGFNFNSSNGNLGYIWNNESGTYGWDSGISAPANMWSLAALVVTPTNAIIYVLNANSVISSSHTYTHVAQSFNGTPLIGNDASGTYRSFDGMIDEVGVFAGALSQAQIFGLYSAASGVTNFGPAIATQPTSLTLYEQQTAQFNVVAGGSIPLSYQWQSGNNGAFANMADNGRISGSRTSALIITNVSLTDPTNYIVIITNAYGSVTGTLATLTVLPTLPAINFTMITNQALGNDWNTTNCWVPDGQPASLSSIQRPGSTYELLPGAQLRTPDITSASFPGMVLTVNGTNAQAARGVVALKAATNYFKKIILNGGQLSNFRNGTGDAVVTGNEISVQSGSSSRITAGNGSLSGKAIRIESVLTGQGDLQCQASTSLTFIPGMVGGINIAGLNNSYSGTWDVVSGALTGSGPGSLGSNTITVEAAGALQTAYNINNPNGDLILSGQMHLTQDDKFRKVTVNGVQLAAGTYSLNQLTNAYPTNFPSTWVGQTGVETYTNASGSLTVLQGGAVASPGNVSLNYSGGTLQLTWTNANTLLLTATNILGPWTTNIQATQPYQVTNDMPQQYFRLQGQ